MEQSRAMAFCSLKERGEIRHLGHFIHLLDRDGDRKGHKSQKVFDKSM
jgi:hypothetical protein